MKNFLASAATAIGLTIGANGAANAEALTLSQIKELTPETAATLSYGNAANCALSTEAVKREIRLICAKKAAEGRANGSLYSPEKLSSYEKAENIAGISTSLLSLMNGSFALLNQKTKDSSLRTLEGLEGEFEKEFSSIDFKDFKTFFPFASEVFDFTRIIRQKALINGPSSISTEEKEKAFRYGQELTNIVIQKLEEMKAASVNLTKEQDKEYANKIIASLTKQIKSSNELSLMIFGKAYVLSEKTDQHLIAGLNQ